MAVHRRATCLLLPVGLPRLRPAQNNILYMATRHRGVPDVRYCGWLWPVCDGLESAMACSGSEILRIISPR